MKKKSLPVDLRLWRTRTQKPSPWACGRDNPSIKTRRLNATSHHAVKQSGHYSKLIKHQTSDRNRIRISRYGSQLPYITMPVATRNHKHVSQSMPSRRLIRNNLHKAPPPPTATPPPNPTPSPTFTNGQANLANVSGSGGDHQDNCHSSQRWDHRDNTIAYVGMTKTITTMAHVGITKTIQ